MPVESGRHNAGEHRQFTSLSSSTNIAPSSYAGAVDGVFLQAETQNVRVRFDAGTPTASVGLILYAGAAPQYFPFAPASIYAIEVAASAKLNAEFVGPKKPSFVGA